MAIYQWSIPDAASFRQEPTVNDSNEIMTTVQSKSESKPIILATRGSALAMVQTHWIMARCRKAFPHLVFEVKIIKTTGDKLQTAALANPGMSSTKGLFTKELEQALLENQADLAVHSLKDLPTDLPQGLHLGAVSERADARDMLIYRGPSLKNGFAAGLNFRDLPMGAAIATSSTRRQAQLLALRPDLKIQPIRGNVGTRLKKLHENPDIDATILAAAGLGRLNFQVSADGTLHGTPQNRSGHDDPMPGGLMAAPMDPATMIPCVGQGAIGIETRTDDELVAEICQTLNHAQTASCVTAERAFLHAMGGGCQSPVAAWTNIVEGRLKIRAVSFRKGPAFHAEEFGPIDNPRQLGESVARCLIAMEEKPAVPS